MAYDYLGTMDRDQFNDLVLFARKQKTLGVWQEDHARAEIRRNDCFLVKMLKAHDVFFGGSLGVEQSLPELKDRSLDGSSASGGSGGISWESGEILDEARCAGLPGEPPKDPGERLKFEIDNLLSGKPTGLCTPWVQCLLNLGERIKTADPGFIGGRQTFLPCEDEPEPEPPEIIDIGCDFFGDDTTFFGDETTKDLIANANCTELGIEVPLNEPHLAHPGREDAFRLRPFSLKIPFTDLKDVLSDADSSEVLAATKRQFYPSLKHQRESLEWRVRKIQHRQEQLEEAWRRRNFGRDGVIERYVSLLEQMFGEAEPDQTHWWSLNPKPGSSDQKRPEVIFKKDKFSQSQKDLELSIKLGVDFQLEVDF